MIALEKTDRAAADQLWQDARTEAKRQHEYTEGILRAYLPTLGYSPRKVEAFVALTHHDPFGGLIASKEPQDSAAAIADIEAGAAKAGMPAEDFFALAKRFYFSDAGAYTRDAGGDYVPEQVYKAEGRKAYTRAGDRLFGPSLDPVFVFDRAARRVELASDAEARTRALFEAFEGPHLRLENGAVLTRADAASARRALAALRPALLDQLAEAARGRAGYMPPALRVQARALGLLDAGSRLLPAVRALLVTAVRRDSRGVPYLGAIPASPYRQPVVSMAVLRSGAHFPFAAVNAEIVRLKALRLSDPSGFRVLLRSLEDGKPVRRRGLDAQFDENRRLRALTAAVLADGFSTVGGERWPNPIESLYLPAPR